MICPRCKIPMKIQGGGRSYHKMKKFRCPNCGLVRMQKIKKKKK
ncbi:MAG: hypothetical protein ACTSRZ_11870 [Promethearchaeota archaeon]